MKSLESHLYLIAPLFLFGLTAGWSIAVHGSFEVFPGWFDTAHYKAIAENGYTVHTDTAFFPAFPYLWGALNWPAWAMGALNLTLWLGALAFLDHVCGIQRRALLISALVPQVLFFAIPYSESLFFIALVFIAYGLLKERLWMTALGVLVAALIRPTAAIVIPALLMARMFSGEKWRSAIPKSLMEGLAGLLGVAAVFYLQQQYTGEYWSFFSAQASWGNGIGWPDFPLRSWGGDMVTIIDGMALFVGLFAGRTLWHTRRGGRTVLNTAERFGLAGMFITALLIIATRGGWLFSLNRFMYATAFFPLALSAWSRTIYVNKQFLGLFAAWVGFSFLLGSYVHILTFFYHLVGGAIIVLVIYALRQRVFRGWVALLLILGSAAMMVYYYQMERWIG